MGGARYKASVSMGRLRLLTLLNLFFLASCTGSLTGSVYLDLNNNEEKEDAEPLITGAEFTVTKDDADYKTGTTNSDGEFKVKLDGSGNYCVEVDQDGLKISDGVTRVSALLTDEAVVNVSALVKFQTSSDNSSDNGSDNSSGDDSSATVEAGKVCEESDGFSWDNDIPVAMIYSGDDLDEETSPATFPGEVITVVLKFPESCELAIFSVPNGVEPHESLNDYYDGATRKFDFDNAIANDADENGVVLDTTSSPLTIDEDPIVTYNFAFVLDEDLLDSTDIGITPRATCPDDATLTLKTFTVDVDLDDLFTLNHTDNLGGGDAVAGSEIDITTTVTNNSAVDRSDVSLSFTATSGPTITFNDTTNCEVTSSTTATCTFDIVSGASQAFLTDFDIPDNVTNTSTFELDATFTVTGDGDTLTEQSKQSYTIQGSSAN